MSAYYYYHYICTTEYRACTPYHAAELVVWYMQYPVFLILAWFRQRDLFDASCLLYTSV